MATPQDEGEMGFAFVCRVSHNKYSTNFNLIRSTLIQRICVNICWRLVDIKYHCCNLLEYLSFQRKWLCTLCRYQSSPWVQRRYKSDNFQNMSQNFRSHQLWDCMNKSIIIRKYMCGWILLIEKIMASDIVYWYRDIILYVIWL